MKLILIAASLLIVPAAAAAVPVQADDSAGRNATPTTGQLSLDLGALPPIRPVAMPDERAATASSRANEPDAPAISPAPFDLDTPIGRLIGDPRARAVLDKDLPGLSTDENLPKFEGLSLRRFQPLTGGQLTDDLLARTAADLAAIRPAKPGKGRNASR